MLSTDNSRGLAVVEVKEGGENSPKRTRKNFFLFLTETKICLNGMQMGLGGND